MNASDPNLDELLKASAKDLICEDLELLHSIDTSNTDISPKAIRRVRRTIKNYDKESWWESVPVACRRAVAVIMIVCTLSFGLSLSITPVRAAIISTFVEWHDKFVSVLFVPEQTAPSVIEVYREPQLQLVDSEKVVVVQNDRLYLILYMQGSEICVTYQQLLMTKEPLDIDRENCTITDIDINGNKGQLFVYDDGSCNMTWSDKEYSYVLTVHIPNVDQKTVLGLAESVN